MLNYDQNFVSSIQKQAHALDMAIEAHRLLKGDAGREIPGVTQEEANFTAGRTVTIRIINGQGEQALGRSIGTYVTIELPGLHSPTADELLYPASAEIARVIKSLLPPYANHKPVLIVGLGNFRTTADAIGPKVIGHIQPTCHFFSPDLAADIRPVAAIAPGVVGSTGIETAALIKGVCSQISPAAVIVVDALAAGRLGGVMRSIQICDTGIRPGSGVANHRTAINRDYLGVPVLAIGIPTVVRAASIITEAVDTAIKQNADLTRLTAPNNAEGIPTPKLPQNVSEQMLSPFPPNLVLTPKDADELVPLAALIIAAGLTRALHPAAAGKDFAAYMQRL